MTRPLDELPPQACLGLPVLSEVLQHHTVPAILLACIQSDPHLWLGALGSDGKDKVTDTSEPKCGSSGVWLALA